MHESILDGSFLILSIDGPEAEIEPIIGVKQGDVLGPIIFIIYMVALTNTWK